MADEWRIASLSQTIDDDDDDDDVADLVPSTPGQEDIDMASPSQDSASLLGVMTEQHGTGGSGVARGSRGNGDGEHSSGSKEKLSDGTKGDNIDDEGGGGSGGGGGGGRGDTKDRRDGEAGEGDGNGNGDGSEEEKRRGKCEEEESSHEPSSDSSDGLFGTPTNQKQNGASDKKFTAVSSVIQLDSQEDKTTGKHVELESDDDVVSSQEDVIPSQKIKATLAKPPQVEHQPLA
ncbi:hypothetical protein OTU49_010530 [Cherax quadricarinatus]|uniref:Uncharacterized protein n=1 Tax=Cherax quadricarinatus TaxID=27406 RepID=A0AAW0WDQ8_CHEQU